VPSGAQGSSAAGEGLRGQAAWELLGCIRSCRTQRRLTAWAARCDSARSKLHAMSSWPSCTRRRIKCFLHRISVPLLYNFSIGDVCSDGGLVSLNHILPLKGAVSTPDINPCLPSPHRTRASSPHLSSHVRSGPISLCTVCRAFPTGPLSSRVCAPQEDRDPQPSQAFAEHEARGMAADCSLQQGVVASGVLAHRAPAPASLAVGSIRAGWQRLCGPGHCLRLANSHCCTREPCGALAGRPDPLLATRRRSRSKRRRCWCYQPPWPGPWAPRPLPEARPGAGCPLPGAT